MLSGPTSTLFYSPQKNSYPWMWRKRTIFSLLYRLHAWGYRCGNTHVRPFTSWAPESLMQKKSCQRNSYCFPLRTATLLLIQFPLYCLALSVAETPSFTCALWSCFPQIICQSPLGLLRDSRQTRCASLIKESDVYKCKHSILFTRCSALPLICGGGVLYISEAVCED